MPEVGLAVAPAVAPVATVTIGDVGSGVTAGVEVPKSSENAGESEPPVGGSGEATRVKVMLFSSLVFPESSEA